MSNHQSSGSRGKAIATPPLPVNCPRCDSPNTKFCYYNNYSLSQPRHFCKACKRYWTNGGALRNVPIGGGCRKGKKSNRSSSFDSKEYSSGASSYSDMSRFKFYDGHDFQLGGGLTKFPSFNNISTTPTVGGQLVSSFGDIPTVPIAASNTVSNFALNPNSETNLSQFMDFNNLPSSYSSPSSILKQDRGVNNNIGSFNEGLVPEMGPTNGNLASFMESFGSINQDLHWKSQQERMSMMLNGGVGNNYQQQDGLIGTSNHLESLTQVQKPLPMLFHNLENSSKPAGDSRKEVNGIVNAATANLPTEWYFGNPTYAPALNQLPSSNGNGKGIQGWDNFDQYTSLP